MYKITITICISLLFLGSCSDSEKKTGQIDNYINNDNQAGDEEGYISSGDQGVFLEDADIVIEGKTMTESDTSTQVSSENPLNF